MIVAINKNGYIKNKRTKSRIYILAQKVKDENKVSLSFLVKDEPIKM